MTPTKILFICHGNICRSTMAQYVMQHLVEEAGVADMFCIDSAATTTEEVGNGVHHGTRKVLAKHGVYCGSHRARKMQAAEYDDFDLIIAMDRENLHGLARILGEKVSWRDDAAAAIRRADPAGKIHLLMDYTDRPGDVEDPWDTGDLDTTWDDVWEGCGRLLESLLAAG